MTEHPEPYGLMRLAERFGVDYGDVMAWAHYLRHERVTRRGDYPQGRFIELDHVLNCLHAQLGEAWYAGLLHRLVEHANARWGTPEPGFAPIIITRDDNG